MNSVRILLAHAIDYAGFFPPAALPMSEAVRNYAKYREAADAWALGRFVAPAARAGETGLPPEFLSLVDGQTERAGSTLYLERPVELLAEVQRAGACAKIRTGGLTPESVPSPAAVAGFVMECARLRLPFKATAGLHHAVRSGRPPATHGFLNVFLAAALAWEGGAYEDVLAVLEESDAAAFRFGDASVSWRGHTLSDVQLRAAREKFIVGFGSCSFEEPLLELREMGLL